VDEEKATTQNLGDIPSPASLVGTLIDGRYQVLEKLGDRFGRERG